MEKPTPPFYSGSRRHRRSVHGAALALSMLVALPAAAQPADEMFKGKTITIQIAFDPGGSYDQYGRLIARHLPKHIPGQPTIVPVNAPGVSGLRVANTLYQAAPRDGTVLGVVAQTIALAEQLGTPGLQFKTREFNWIGRVMSSIDVMVTWHTSKVKTIQDAMEHVATVGGSGPGGAGHDYPLVINFFGGTKFRVIPGYQSAAQMMIAMERGETDGATTAWNTLKTTKQHWLAEKTINIPIQYGVARHRDLQHIPAMIEMGKTDEDRQIIALYASGVEIGRSLMAPPGVPANNVGVLRRGFEAMLKDPEFLDEIARTKGELEPLPGEKLQEFIAGLGELPPHLAERARQARIRH